MSVFLQLKLKLGERRYLQRGPGEWPFALNLATLETPGHMDKILVPGDSHTLRDGLRFLISNSNVFQSCRLSGHKGDTL